MRVVVALGGYTLLGRVEPIAMERQREDIRPTRDRLVLSNREK